MLNLDFDVTVIVTKLKYCLLGQRMDWLGRSNQGTGHEWPKERRN